MKIFSQCCERARGGTLDALLEVKREIPMERSGGKTAAGKESAVATVKRTEIDPVPQFNFNSVKLDFPQNGGYKIVNKKLVSMGLCLGIVTLASLTTLAQDNPQSRGIVTINGGRQTVVLRGQSKVVTPAPPEPNLKKIYSNLGTGTNVYNCCSGWTMSGPTSLIGHEWDTATAFTPKTAATLVRIRVAIEYVAGTNGATVTLNTDSNGQPSTKVLHKWNFSNLHAAGSCCQLSTGNAKKGIKLRKGKQYWLVGTTPSDTWDAWNENSTGALGTFAQREDKGNWSVFTNSTIGAMALYGQ
jgi:hypothetical protein